MASIESWLYYGLLRFINKKKSLELQFAFRKFDFYSSTEPPKEIFKVCDVRKHQIAGRNVFTLTPFSDPSPTQILYLHGGAFVQGFVKQHWTFLSALVKETHCKIIVPDYPLAPTYTYHHAFEMVSAVYNDMIKGRTTGKIILMGDSSGGGFALALGQKLRFEPVPQPNQLILLSPWLDITLTNPEITGITQVDPFLSPASLRKAGKVYAGDSDTAIAMLSPINGTLDHLGEISIFIGSRDILVADTRKLKALAEKTGVQIHYHEYKDMVHAWMLLNFRESKQAKREIMDTILRPIAS
ncbi:MAG TPA: alpha/beta hydrolase [Chryseolinea sp.]